MAGMLPGVESARRRRFHHSGGCLDSPSLSLHNSTRRSSSSLYAKNHEPLLPSFSSLKRSMSNQTHPDENIAGAAREAKQRLDEKFKHQRKSENKKNAIKSSLIYRQNTYVEGRSSRPKVLENNESKKNGLRKLSWTKLRLKGSEEEDCAVCLELLKNGETLTHLHCEHKFHSKCLKPWLDQNSCPCCRTTIISP